MKNDFLLKKLYKMRTLILLLFLFVFNQLFAQRNIGFNINTQLNRKSISPYIYGLNQYNMTTENPMNVTQNRFGGNRSTAYNWETNYSNAGSDYNNSSDNWWMQGLGLNAAIYRPIAGSALQAFSDTIYKAKGLPMITLQAAGYVSADANGTVTCTAPCDRWVKVLANKPGKNFVYPPVLTDNVVYMDEEVNWLISKYGTSANGGIKFYEIDNEPDIWNGTHKLIRPTLPTPTQLGAITEEYAKMVKSLDPNALIFGYVGTGAWGIEHWIKGTDFLADMKTRSVNAGIRLLDVFDIHFYAGDLYNLSGNKAWDYLQATRILWDSTYYFKNAWGTAGNFNAPARLLRRYKDYIKNNYPGTKLAITEWNSTLSSKSIYDGLFSADILGVFINEDVFAANEFSNADGYTATAFKLYRNYDNSKSTFGDIAVNAVSSDYTYATIYSSVESETNDKILHMIVINKDSLQDIKGSFTITGNKNYTKGKVYYFDKSSQQIKKGIDIAAVSNNTFNYTLPKLAAIHMILTTDDACLTPVLGSAVNLCDSSEITLNTGIDNPFYSFIWKKNNVILSNESSAKLLIHQSGIYDVTAKKDGCPDKTSSVNITSYLLDAPDISICKGETAFLKVNGNQNYAWYENVNDANPVSTVNPYAVTPDVSKVYYVKQTDLNTYILGQNKPGGQSNWSIGSANLNETDKKYYLKILQPTAFKSVEVYPTNNNTNVKIRIYNSTGTFNKTVTANGLNKGINKIAVNTDLPIDDYTVDLVGTNNNMDFENANGIYPITQKGILTLDASASWAQAWNGFFYNWTFTSGYHCAPAKVQVNVETCIGMEKTSNENNIIVSPNPSNTFFTLTTNRQTHIEIFSMIGDKISEQTINGTFTFGENLSSGIYFLKLSNGLQNKIIKVVKD